MHAAKFVPALAELLGVNVANLRVIDRKLAENGFRKKARGKHVPQVSRREALLLLLATMTSSAATRSHEKLDNWLWFDPKGFASKSVTNRVKVPESNLTETFGFEFDGPLRKKLIDVLELICDRFASGELGRFFPVELEITLSDGTATIRCGKKNPQAEITFAGSITRRKASGGLREIKSVGADVLGWIGESCPKDEGG